MGLRSAHIARADVGGRLGFVSTEGGPLLIADRALIGQWSGADGPDYDRACDLLEAELEASEQARGLLVEIAIGEGTAALWDIAPGTVAVHRTARNVAMVEQGAPGSATEAWPAPDEPGVGPQVQLEVTSGFVVVLWAPESGADVLAEDPEDGRALNLSVEEAGIELRFENGTRLLASRKRTDTEPAACWLMPSPA